MAAGLSSGAIVTNELIVRRQIRDGLFNDFPDVGKELAKLLFGEFIRHRIIVFR
jgi:hypothetical protein